MTSGTAVVTGAAGGLGEAFARDLAGRGHRVLLVDRRADALAAVVDDIGPAAEAAVVDLTDRGDLERLAARVAALADLDVLVNNAGFGFQGTFDAIPARTHLDMVDVNVTATVCLSRAALPGMRARGRGAVINVASIGGFRPGTQWSVYGASKAFAIFFSQALAAELDGTGVRVQALCPGFIRTGFHAAAGFDNAGSWLPRSFWMTPEAVVQSSLSALAAGPVVVLPGVRSRLQHHLGAAPSARDLLYGVLRRLRL